MNATAGVNASGAPSPQTAPPAGDGGVDTLRFFRTAFALGAGLLAYHLIARFDLASLLFAWHWWAVILFRTQATAFAIAACLALADRRASHDAPMRLRYVAAVVAGNVVAAAATLALLHWSDLPYAGPTELQWVLYIQIEYLALSGGAVIAIVDRRRARAAQARLHAAQRRRVDAARRMFGVRLQAMQARVEPRFLFDTLAGIRLLHAQDSRRAERLLDDLIAYLRAAMPGTRDRSPTVRQEVELVRAWLSIVDRTTGCGVGHDIDVPPEALDACAPPMLLLPLARCVLADRARPGPVAQGFRLAAAVRGTRLEFRIASPAWTGGAQAEEDLARLRERLGGLYGGNASLVLAARSHGGVEATLDIPLEPAHSGAATAATGRSAS